MTYQTRVVCAGNAQRSYYVASRLAQEYCDTMSGHDGVLGHFKLPDFGFSSGGHRVPALLAGTVKPGRMGKIIAASIKRGSYDDSEARKIADIYKNLGSEEAFEQYMADIWLRADKDVSVYQHQQLRAVFMNARPAHHKFLNDEVRKLAVEEGLEARFLEQGFNKMVKPEDGVDLLIAAAKEDVGTIAKLYYGYYACNPDAMVKIIQPDPENARIIELGTTTVKMPFITSICEETRVDLADDPAAGEEFVRAMIRTVNGLAPELFKAIVLYSMAKMNYDDL